MRETRGHGRVEGPAEQREAGAQRPVPSPEETREQDLERKQKRLQTVSEQLRALSTAPSEEGMRERNEGNESLDRANELVRERLEQEAARLRSELGGTDEGEVEPEQEQREGLMEKVRAAAGKMRAETMRMAHEKGLDTMVMRVREKYEALTPAQRTALVVGVLGVSAAGASLGGTAGLIMKGAAGGIHALTKLPDVLEKAGTVLGKIAESEPLFTKKVVATLALSLGANLLIDTLGLPSVKLSRVSAANPEHTTDDFIRETEHHA